MELKLSQSAVCAGSTVTVELLRNGYKLDPKNVTYSVEPVSAGFFENNSTFIAELLDESIEAVITAKLRYEQGSATENLTIDVIRQRDVITTVDYYTNSRSTSVIKQQAFQDGYVKIGSYEGNSIVNGELVVIRQDAEGNKIWQKTWERGTYWHSLEVKNDFIFIGGDAYLRGEIYASIKNIDREGNEIFQLTIPGGKLKDLAVNENYEILAFQENGTITKFDANGQELWKKAKDFVIMTAGFNKNNELFGSISDGATGKVLHLSEEGEVIWEQPISSYASEMDFEGNNLVVGYYSNRRASVKKFSPQGDVLFEGEYLPEGYESFVFSDLKVLDGGDMLLSGGKNFYHDAVVMKINKEGHLDWVWETNRISPNTNTVAFNAIKNSKGYRVFCLYKTSLFLIQLTEEGEQYACANRF
ncbi:outer membrane protein assembly factor BamB family protein [Litoribacter populi]|uniref:outer membrane protein assembly factor BamB family protein n=1 Tax=Litoribacter populi TaxID=2598460 RepID=UPI00117E2A04|nr:PQQ-binding-like beta-propeller repeat protein [Litoribacter populi]